MAASSLKPSWLEDMVSAPMNTCSRSHPELYRIMAAADADTAAAADDESKKMVELLLGSTITRHPTTASAAASSLNLLYATILGVSSASSNGGSALCPSTLAAPPMSSMIYPTSTVVTDSSAAEIELETESPLPSGWEKCLDLKTGRLYYLNRTTGLTFPSGGRKPHPRHSTALPLSPTTSELTAEVSIMEALTRSNDKEKNLYKRKHEEAAGHCAAIHGPSHVHDDNDEGALDLNLSLHVGGSPVKPKKEIAISAPHIFLHSVSSSSSSSTPSPSTSFTLKHSPSAEPLASGHTSYSHVSKEEERHKSEGNGSHGQLPSDDHEGHSSTSMVTMACAHCLMFVMLSRANPKCPRCGTCPDNLDLIIADNRSPNRFKPSFLS